MITGLNILPPDTSDPKTANQGDAYYNLINDKFMIYSGTNWLNMSIEPSIIDQWNKESLCSLKYVLGISSAGNR